MLLAPCWSIDTCWLAWLRISRLLHLICERGLGEKRLGRGAELTAGSISGRHQVILSALRACLHRPAPATITVPLLLGYCNHRWIYSFNTAADQHIGFPPLCSLWWLLFRMQCMQCVSAQTAMVCLWSSAQSRYKKKKKRRIIRRRHQAPPYCYFISTWSS